MSMAKSAKAEAAEIIKRLEKGRKKVPPKKALTSWSFSRYSDYKQCPLKAKLKHLSKVEEPPNEAMARGADVGRLAEFYVKGTIAKLPAELSKFKKTFAEARALFKKSPQRVVVEDQWGLKKDWSRTAWNDWEGCWLRVKIDYGNMTGPKTMRVVDWKTGKYRRERRDEYVEQLELYACATLSLNEQLDEVKCFLAYLDVGVMFPEPGTPDEELLTFRRSDLPRLKKAWDKRTRAMLLDRSFAPRPNDRCSWCWYRKDNAAQLPGGKALCRY